MRRIHYTLPLLLMTLALAGCSGSGGDGMSSAGSTTTPIFTRGGGGAETPEPPPEVQDPTPVEAAEMEYTDAVQAVDDLADDASDAVRLTAEELVLAKAMDYLQALEDADAVHSAVTRGEELVASARVARDATKGRIDDAKDLMERMAALDLNAKAFQKAVKAASDDEALDRENVFVSAGMKVTASEVETGDGGMGLAATYGKFEKSTKVAPPVMDEGWRAFVHERSMKTVGENTLDTSDDTTTSDRVTVYTTQTDPADEYFAEFFKAARAGETTGGVLANGTIEFVDTQLPGTAMSSGLPEAGNSIEYLDGDANHPTPTGRNQLSGSYRGVDGVFNCADATCEAEADDDGKMTFTEGTWTFIPDGNLETVILKGVIVDTDYLTLGHWVRTADKAAGPTYMVGVFATGSGTSAVLTAIDEVIGTAEYAGPAVGLFSKREYAADGKGDVMMSGQFTASANLMADFDAPHPHWKHQRYDRRVHARWRGH